MLYHIKFLVILTRSVFVHWRKGSWALDLLDLSIFVPTWWMRSNWVSSQLRSWPWGMMPDVYVKWYERWKPWSSWDLDSEYIFYYFLFFYVFLFGWGCVCGWMIVWQDALRWSLNIFDVLNYRSYSALAFWMRDEQDLKSWMGDDYCYSIVTVLTRT